MLYEQTTDDKTLQKLQDAVGVKRAYLTEDVMNVIRLGGEVAEKELKKIEEADALYIVGTALDFTNLDFEIIEKNKTILLRDAKTKEETERMLKLHELIFKNNRFLFDEVDESHSQPGTMKGEGRRTLGSEKRDYEVEDTVLIDRVIGDIVNPNGKLNGLERPEAERNMMVARAFYHGEVLPEMTVAEIRKQYPGATIVHTRINADKTEEGKQVLQKLAEAIGVPYEVFTVEIDKLDEQNLTEAQKERVRRLRASLNGRANALKQFEGGEVGKYQELIARQFEDPKQQENALKLLEQLEGNQSLKEAARQILIALAGDTSNLTYARIDEINAIANQLNSREEKDVEKFKDELNRLKAKGYQITNDNIKQIISLWRAGYLAQLGLLDLNWQIKVKSNDVVAPRLQQSDPFLSAHTQIVFLRALGLKRTAEDEKDAASLRASDINFESAEGVKNYLKRVTLSGHASRSTRERTVRRIFENNSVFQGFSGTLTHVIDTAHQQYGVDTIVYTHENPYFRSLQPKGFMDAYGMRVVSPTAQSEFDRMTKEEKDNARTILANVTGTELEEIAKGNQSVIRDQTPEVKKAIHQLAVSGKLSTLRYLELTDALREIQKKDLNLVADVDQMMERVYESMHAHPNRSEVFLNGFETTADEARVLERLEETIMKEAQAQGDTSKQYTFVYKDQ
ncbi:MAG: hypothetical protein HY351_02565, partial [Candidatus Omnitrophica bacterium]|nr:hypothetical protein [Candidatus Omnitrophota bacterium]